MRTQRTATVGRGEGTIVVALARPSGRLDDDDDLESTKTRNILPTATCPGSLGPGGVIQGDDFELDDRIGPDRPSRPWSSRERDGSPDL
mmetsp:Transcript_39738/g.73254  ORF Transcript_39738/g.73254 Transcript_39738/m.73254 type:complete len:89 (+) Transcript_39738:368-634(+)